MSTVLESTGITLKEYHERRDRICQMMLPQSIAILPSGSQKYRNADTEYAFRQDSNFYYLTGFSEPKSLMVLLKTEKNEAQFILFCQSRDPQLEIWTGKKLGIQDAQKQLGADDVHAFEDLDHVMPELLENRKEIFYSLGYDSDWDSRITGWLNSVRVKKKQGAKATHVWVDLTVLIHEIRLFKSSAEIALMRKVSEISANAHVVLIKACEPNKMEYELEALFVSECMHQGCRSMAYPSIVGGGKNACTLHYISNDKSLQSGDLVLVDAGAEYQNYAADITRTYPVNGHFSADQKSLYQLVLKAQLAAIECVRPGVRWNILQETILGVLTQGLIDLGILTGTVESVLADKSYRKFYMHGSGHWLGLDVHDAGEYKEAGQYRQLKPGMVLTVEPGLYITPEAPGVDKRWWGIGIRIEDDVLVTENGHEVLTKVAPKTIEEIEQLMKKNY